MKQSLIYLGVALVIFMSGWVTKGKVDPTIIDNTVTDSVFVDRPYEVEVIKEVIKPIRVTEYVTKYDTVTSVKVVKDTVVVEVDAGPILYNTQFLTNFPDRPKFLGLTSMKGTVSFTGLTTDGQTKTETWAINSPNFEIGSDGGNFVEITPLKHRKKWIFLDMGAGYIKNLQYEGLYWELNGKIRILGTNIKGTLNLNEQPFGTIGLHYDLN